VEEAPFFLLDRSTYLRIAPKFADIQERVARIIKNKILVGHRIWNFLSVIEKKKRLETRGFH